MTDINVEATTHDFLSYKIKFCYKVISENTAIHISVASKMGLVFLGQFEKFLKEKPDCTIEDFYEHYIRYINWDKESKYPLLNQGTVLSHLFGMLYPWESIKDKIPTIPVSKLDTKKWGRVNIVHLGDGLQGDDFNLRRLTRKMRNALVHSDVEIDSTNKLIFTFKDTKDKKDTYHAIVAFEIEELISFMLALQSSYLGDW